MWQGKQMCLCVFITMNEEEKYPLFSMNEIYCILFLLNHNIGRTILGFKLIYGNVHYEHESGGHV